MSVITLNEILSGDLRPVLPPKYNLVFIHQYKSYGSTFSYLLAKNYRPESIMHMNADQLNSNQRSCLRKNNKQFRVVFGHLMLQDCLIKDNGWDKTLVISLVREPVSRIVSYYNYILTKKNHQLHEQIKRMSFSEFIRSGCAVDIENGQTKRLSARREKELRVDEQGEEDIFCEIKNRVSLLLPAEEFDSILLALKKHLGWTDIYYKVRNRSQPHIKPQNISSEDRSLIFQKNQLDKKLYSHANEVAQSLLRESKITTTDKVVFKFKNRFWGWLVS